MYNTVQEIIKKYAGPSYNWKIGDIVEHPKGYKVKITDGYYLDPIYHRVSNFWSWVVLNKKGEETKKKGCGYGW